MEFGVGFGMVLLKGFPSRAVAHENGRPPFSCTMFGVHPGTIEDLHGVFSIYRSDSDSSSKTMTRRSLEEK